MILDVRNTSSFKLYSELQMMNSVYNVKFSHGDNVSPIKNFQTNKGANIQIQQLIDEWDLGIVHRSVMGRHNQKRGINEDAQGSGKRMPSLIHMKGKEAYQRFRNLDGTDRFGLGCCVGICAMNKICGVLPVPQVYFKQEKSNAETFFIRK